MLGGLSNRLAPEFELAPPVRPGPPSLIVGKPLALGEVGRGPAGLVEPAAAGSDLIALLLQQLLHQVGQDGVQIGVDTLDHVEDAGHVPDQVELGEGLWGHIP